jgi:predicted dienelactone hydrolase
VASVPCVGSRGWRGVAGLTAVAALAIGAGVPAGAASSGPTGSYGVARFTLTFVDSSRPTPANGTYAGAPTRTLPTLISYPVLHGQPAPGARPVVVFATGSGDSPTTYQALFDFWVRAGYIVAEPTFPLSNSQAPGGSTVSDLSNQPGDVSFVITQLLTANRSPRSRLHGRINPQQVAVIGKSLGALTVFEVGYNVATRDPRVKAVVALTGLVAGSGAHFTGITTPLLLEHGTADTTVPISGSVNAYAAANPPKFFVTLIGQTHGSAFGGGTHPAEVVVERTTIDFLDRYLRGRSAGLARLTQDGNVPGVATVQTTP